MSFWGFVEKLLPVAVAAGATIYGASQSSKANTQAANAVSQSSQQSTDQLVQAQREATAANLEGLRVAQQTMQGQQQQAAPGLTAIQRIINRGTGLTPGQTQIVDDARLRSLDALQGGGLRGSAKATAAVVRDVEGRIVSDLMDRNQQRADQAASNLSGQYFNAGRNIADLNLATGNAISSGLLNTGNTVSNNALTQGNIAASNMLGQAQIKGQAIGDIGAVIADQLKASDQKKRDSSYQQVGSA